MKLKNILFTLFFLSIIQFTMAQVTPIETVTDAKQTTYSTKSYNNYDTTFKNQSYDLIRKLQENLRLVDNVDLTFIKSCVLNDTSLQNTNSIFYVEYIVNQNGNVLGCRLINYGNKVSLSNNEVECILTAAMNNTFSFNNIPNDVNDFYSRIMKRYVFK